MFARMLTIRLTLVAVLATRDLDAVFLGSFDGWNS